MANEVGWVSKVGMGAVAKRKIPVTAGNKTPDRPACSQFTLLAELLLAPTQ
jgi:hypothetical protein